MILKQTSYPFFYHFRTAHLEKYGCAATATGWYTTTGKFQIWPSLATLYFFSWSSSEVQKQIRQYATPAKWVWCVPGCFSRTLKQKSSPRASQAISNAEEDIMLLRTLLSFHPGIRVNLIQWKIFKSHIAQMYEPKHQIHCSNNWFILNPTTCYTSSCKLACY